MTQAEGSVETDLLFQPPVTHQLFEYGDDVIGTLQVAGAADADINLHFCCYSYSAGKPAVVHQALFLPHISSGENAGL